MTEEDKGAYKYCKNCGRVLSPTYEAELCPTCEENQLFDKVRDYIRKNDVTEMQVAEHFGIPDRKSTRLNSSHRSQSRMPSSA